MKLISIIIPVYNVEKYLDRCINSIINQSYTDLEIILVDDGSPDKCPQICDEYALKDNRIKVIHKLNGGQSSARNAGLDIATGDYITFIDSDDWIGIDTYEYCMKLINETDAEVVQFDYSYVIDNRVLKSDPREIIKVYENKDVLQNYMTSSTYTGSYSVCRCLFHNKLIGNVRFREGKINEDLDWKFLVLQKCKRMVDSNLVKYYYWQSGNSTSGAPLKIQDFQLREAADLLCELASKETYGTIAFLGKVKKARTAFSLLCKIAYFGVSDSIDNRNKIVKELTKEHRANLSILLRSPIPLNRKILSILFAINYSFTEKIIRIAK